ncbi:NADH-quinone oxidoreductase subunit L [Flavobacterium rhizosphaerae]|uniref:NADH-quinone oxidoreductase subunit L n=1 Tax=Flavobacterium rhizosphaerae TaxID=3163298 RepID=A0ABW8YVD5_9FLAO
METNLALLLLLAPFAGFLINVFFGKKLGHSTPGWIGTIAVAASFGATLTFFLQVMGTHEPVMVNLFPWLRLTNFSVDFSFQLDQLSLLWLMFVTGIGTLIHLYSISYMHDDENVHKFFAYLNLFIFFMIMLVMGSNLLIMFIGWEGVGLCSYLLIGFWYKNQEYNDAAKKAFIMNRIGDLGFLIGIFILAYLFHTVEYNGIKAALENGWTVDTTWLGIAMLCLFIGACGKSAQIPLYTWLPDAMAGPTPVSALIHAATMVTAGIFMVTRLNFLFNLVPDVQDIIAIVGAVTSLIAAAIGLAQTDIKKVLAYSTVSQLGLMFLALGCGAYEIAVFHVITHAFFKACLFLGSGSVIHALHGEQDMRNMGGLRKVMKVTFATFLVSSIAISGVPPLAGFWSKDEILMTAFHHNPVLWAIGSIASIMTAFYMFRLIYLTFYKDFRGTEEQKHHLHESPALITFPLIVLALLATVGGIINLPGSNWLNHYLAPVIAVPAEHHAMGSTTYILMGIAVVGAIIGIALAYFKYIKKGEVPPQDKDIHGITKVVYNKFYVDELYMALIVKPVYGLGNFCKYIVEAALSGIVYGFGKLANALGEEGRTMQNGSIGFYLFIFVMGICSIVGYIFLIK